MSVERRQKCNKALSILGISSRNQISFDILHSHQFEKIIMNTADYLLQKGQDQDIAFLTSHEQYRYGELRDASARLVGEFLSEGLQVGDRVGILGENSLFWAAAYLAVLKLGMVAVPFPTVSTLEDLHRKERFIQCKAICIERRFQRKFGSALDQEVIQLSENVLDRQNPTCWDDFHTKFDINQDAALMLTSGTTARPRAVRVTHRNIQANTDSIIEYLRLTSAEKMLVVLPFYYCFGTSLLHTHLRVGASLVLCNTFAYPETALDMMEDTQSTGLAGVPSTYMTFLRNSSFPKRLLKSLHKVQQAGGKLPVVFIKELMAALPDAQIFVMYGQTEATARLSYLPPELLSSKIGSIGHGIPGVELKVIGENGFPVKPGEVGEIYAWGDNISPGYFNDPEASAEKFIDGVLHTGDLATLDEDGFIYIVDRKSDFIKVMGRRVSSQEVEAVILERTEIVSAAAVGEPDEVQGEAIKVFVTLKKGSQITPDELLNYCKAKMVRYMVPKEIVIVDQLPLNAHGKVVKSELRRVN
jgi:long-chain acyl-CoA synthetase